MQEEYSQEKREFVRVSVSVPVRYRFLAPHRDDPELDEIYDGETKNLSGGGLLLEGQVPLLPWVPELLMGKIKVAVRLELPEHAEYPIEGVTRVAWLETLDEYTQETRMGLEYREITSEDKDQIFNFVVATQMPD